MRSGAIGTEIISGGPAVDAAVCSKIDEALEAWFGEFQRELAFRKTKDPYAVMVAEYMLQQTTVATVEGYFPKFMAAFPTVQALASAGEEAVLAQWAGLGYYRRARQLHVAAKAIVAEHGGVVPADPDELQRLPGIGKYTAGAIASTAYDVAAPILEANTIRVFSRLAGVDGIIGDSSFTKKLWEIAADFVREARSPGVFNIAAMELGSLVCRPVPQCEVCPVQEFCRAYRAGIADKIPTPAPRRETVELAMVAVVAGAGEGRFLVRRIPAGQWHAGMYEFPAFRQPAELDGGAGAVEGVALKELGVRVDNLQPYRQLRYQVTHHRVRLQVYRGDLREGASLQDGCQILALADISSLPMGSAQKKILKALMETEF